MLHSLATSQGSDYRDNDPTVEPLVELYQGYHAAYEYAGGPRAETRRVPGIRFTAATSPLGFYWNALKKGYKLGIAGQFGSHRHAQFVHHDLFAVVDARGDCGEHAQAACVRGDG